MDRRDQTTHFGFRDVPLRDKQTLVNDVFHSVAQRYVNIGPRLIVQKLKKARGGPKPKTNWEDNYDRYLAKCKRGKGVLSAADTKKFLEEQTVEEYAYSDEHLNKKVTEFRARAADALGEL